MLFYFIAFCMIDESSTLYVAMHFLYIRDMIDDARGI